MAKYKIAWMPGDGVGHDVMEAARLVLDRLKLDAEYVPCDIGWEFWCKEGNALPDRTVKALKETTCGLFGAITSKPQSEAKEELAPGTERQRAGLLFAHRRAAPNVQPAHQHAAVQKLSRQPAELSREQDHQSQRRRRPDRSGGVSRKYRRHVRRGRVLSASRACLHRTVREPEDEEVERQGWIGKHRALHPDHEQARLY